MHTHRVDVRWKNSPIIVKADHDFFGLGGGFTGGERCQKFIEQFLKKAHIFADEQIQQLQTVVTIDLKEIKVASRADARRPLTVLKVNGVALMFLRPDQAKEKGLLFKLCPHDGVRLTEPNHFGLEVSRFNASVPLSAMEFLEEPEQAVA